MFLVWKKKQLKCVDLFRKRSQPPKILLRYLVNDQGVSPCVVDAYFRFVVVWRYTGTTYSFRIILKCGYCWTRGRRDVCINYERLPTHTHIRTLVLCIICTHAQYRVGRRLHENMYYVGKCTQRCTYKIYNITRCCYYFATWHIWWETKRPKCHARPGRKQLLYG